MYFTLAEVKVPVTKLDFTNALHKKFFHRTNHPFPYAVHVKKRRIMTKKSIILIKF
jgi:hypothetical protein